MRLMDIGSSPRLFLADQQPWCRFAETLAFCCRLLRASRISSGKDQILVIVQDVGTDQTDQIGRGSVAIIAAEIIAVEGGAFDLGHTNADLLRKRVHALWECIEVRWGGAQKTRFDVVHT